jgi:adenine/guanine phosphoribosyltransferase-like PRPP-binding protein
MQSVLNEENIFDLMNTMLKSAVSVVNQNSNRDANGNNKNKYYLGGSIARYSKGLIMSFPVLCDDTLSIDTAQLVSKADEKNITTMLEMLFSSITLKGTEGVTGKDFISIFHRNIDTMSMDDIIDATNDFVNSQVREASYLKDPSIHEIRECVNEMCANLKLAQKRFPENSFSENSLNRFLVRETYNKTVVFEAQNNNPTGDPFDKSAIERDKFTYQQQRDAEKARVDADIVVGVPDSGLAAAEGYALESGVPFALAFHKNSYIGRSFIKPTDKERQTAVHMKLSVLNNVVRDKNIVIIDDSIVRGTTMKQLIEMLRSAGAKAVHVRISSPPFLYPCYYGTDVPTSNQLIASHHSTEEVRRNIGADSLEYLGIEDFATMVGNLPLCTACFTNDYPV